MTKGVDRFKIYNDYGLWSDNVIVHNYAIN